MELLKIQTMLRNICKLALVVAIAMTILGSPSLAVPPHPDAKQQWINQGIWNEKVSNWRAFKAAGGCAPSANRIINPKEMRQKLASGLQVVDTIKVITILVDFVDHQWQDQGVAVTPAMFDSILFSNRETDSITMPKGSLTDFYLENSYGLFYVKGDIFGWFRMPQTYAYYEDGNDGLGPKARQLATEAVLAADADGANYSNYDRDNDGFCDGIIIIHPGGGAEAGAYGIWSHAWTINPLNLDGVIVSNYTINPEELSGRPTTIGVVCHEYGHFLGLPDLYDIDPSGAYGIGRWSVMAGGSWNSNGAVPAHFDAWCKHDLGFVNVVDVVSNLDSVAFPAVEYYPVIYRLSNAISLPNEFWYVENRQRIGFDAALPSSGLLIYHVDYAVQGSNNDRTRYFVGVEQADGRFDLESTSGNNGDAGDPFPGSKNARAFHDFTTPSPITNAFLIETNIGVWDISDNDSVMYADLDIEWSRPLLELAGTDSIKFDDPFPLGDDDGDLDPGDTVLFTAGIRNKMLTGYNPRLRLSSNSSHVTFLDNDVPMDTDLDSSIVSNSINPIKILIDDSALAEISAFTLTVTSDALPTPSGTGDFVTTFQFTYAVGTPRVLIVDDDRGQSHQTEFTLVFENFGTPYKLWNKQASGTPSGTDLSNYPMVFWHTGEYSDNVLDSADIAAMKQYMDGGGNLLLSTTSGISQLDNLDSAFLHDYFKAQYDGTIFQQNIRGVGGSILGDGTKFKAPHSIPFTDARQTMLAVDSGAAFLSFTLGSPVPTAGISFSGSYNSVLLSFPLEAIEDNAGGSWWPKDTLINRVLFWLFDSPDSTSPRTIQSFSIVGQTQDHVLDHTPIFSWTASLGYPYDSQTMYEIQVGSDDDWTVAEMWDSGPVASSDNSATYSGAALVDGTSYLARVRVMNGVSWSDWYDISFRMNSPPAAPVALRPTEGAITPNRPTLYVNNAFDAENDPVFYIFEVYADSELTALVASDSGTLPSTDSTGWTVDVNLTYEANFWWRTKSNDYLEFSNYSDVEIFEVQNPPQAPASPVALTPIDTGGFALYNLLPTFDWTSSADPNPFDTIVYRLTLATDPLFLSAINFFNLPSNSYTILDSLKFGQEYFWRVLAKDNTNLSSPTSSVVSFWTWTLGDVNHSNTLDILDLNFQVNYLFRGGAAATPAFIGDYNGDCGTNILDLNYMVNYIFRGGLPPVIGCE